MLLQPRFLQRTEFFRSAAKFGKCWVFLLASDVHGEDFEPEFLVFKNVRDPPSVTPCHSTSSNKRFATEILKSRNFKIDFGLSPSARLSSRY